MQFGKPGAGAPVRTKSGRMRNTIRGAPEIRWEEEGEEEEEEEEEEGKGKGEGYNKIYI